MTPLEAAHKYLNLGLSVIPIRADGSKAPAIGSWKQYQSELPTHEDVANWFHGRELGVAIICGAVSGGLHVLDFETDEIWGEWRRKLSLENPVLWVKLNELPRVRTPRGGRHLYVWQTEVDANRKLAQAGGGSTLIEVRGEGGYVLAPGSALQCHPSGQPYEWEHPLWDWWEKWKG